MRLEQAKVSSERKIQNMADECQNTYTRLRQYESLPKDMRFLVHTPLTEIF